MIRIKAFNTGLLKVRRELFICLFLIGSTVWVYHQVLGYSFLTYDDGLYVTENPHVMGGLNLVNLKWAFTTAHASNWHPLTWISHMLDIYLFGMNSGHHHAMNVVFHTANSLLLFFVLRRMSRDVWQSGFVAALFALHPLHVESVAWVAERKDVLSTFFLMLTLWFYGRYVEFHKLSSYLAAVLFFILGLMAKPMLVTLPLTLFLLDYWPLGRIQFYGFKRMTTPFKILPGWRILWEKIPFFILVIASCLVTFYAQHTGGSMVSLDVYPMGLRISNALIAYVAYIAKMIWPLHLTAFYPHPLFLPTWQVVGAALLLISIFGVCALTARRRPYLSVGWLMYFGMLFPVIGIVQVGDQAMADRYTYVPLIGIFIILAWGMPDFLARWRYKKKVFVWGAALLFPVLLSVTWLQVQHWSDNNRFYEHMIKVTSNNYLAHYNLGVILAEHGERNAAIRHYNQTLHLKPGHVGALNNLGNALLIEGRRHEAIAHFTDALNLDPHNPEIHNNLGVALTQDDQYDQAINHFRIALKIKPDYADARKNLQIALNH